MRRRARNFVRRTVSTMGPIEAKRVIFNAEDIPDYTSAAFDNPVKYDLLICQETVDEEVESDGSSIAQVPLYSRLVGMKMQMFIRGSVATPGVIRWMICKLPDGEDLITSIGSGLTDAAFHSSNDSPNMRELRATTLAKGMILTNESSGVTRFPAFIRRQTLRRLGRLRENDKISLYLANSVQPATNPTLHGFGTLYCRLN